MFPGVLTTMEPLYNTAVESSNSAYLNPTNVNRAPTAWSAIGKEARQETLPSRDSPSQE